jgi:hypothetical protein
MSTASPKEWKQKLRDELAALSMQQYEALKLAVYGGMSPKESAKYEERAKRITKLCGLVKEF